MLSQLIQVADKIMVTSVYMSVAVSTIGINGDYFCPSGSHFRRSPSPDHETPLQGALNTFSV